MVLHAVRATSVTEVNTLWALSCFVFFGVLVRTRQRESLRGQERSRDF